MSPQLINARVYDVAIKSPLELAEKLSSEYGAAIYLKREDLQPVHSFKLRGAYNKMVQLSEAEKKRGVIAASAGNHAQGVALAARKLGISAVIVMPRTTPDIKIDAVIGFGAKVLLHGDSYSEAATYCQGLIQETGRVFIHPFDDPLVIAGQGTIGQEILEQLPEVTHIFVPVGGGGLLAGIAQYVKTQKPRVIIVGVEPQDSSAMFQSIAAGKRVELKHVGIFADGVAVKKVGKRTFETAQTLVDDFITVTTDQICAAMKDTFEATRSIVEPAGALSLAGLETYRLPKNAHAVAICSGANMSFERLQQVAERTRLGSGKEALFAIQMPEQPGALRRFCKEAIPERNITEFSYRLTSRTGALVLVGISVTNTHDRDALVHKIQGNGFGCVDLSNNDLAKEHIRHMVGGHAPEGTLESIYEVEFPERPGALTNFLEHMGDTWNISLFHYRSAASDTGSVMIGYEAAESRTLEHHLASVGYIFEKLKNDPVLTMFI